MTDIGRAETKVILGEWSRQFEQFRPLTKLLYARVNDFVMVGIEFRLPTATTTYHPRIFLHCFNHDDEAIYFDATCDYHYTLGQHRLGGIKYLGTIEEFPDFCGRIKSETALKTELCISDVIAFCEACSPNSFQTMRAIATAWFRLGGIDRARKYLDAKGQAFPSFSAVHRAQLGEPWAIWRTKILDSLDRDRIEVQRVAMLARYAKRGLRDHGIHDR